MSNTMEIKTVLAEPELAAYIKSVVAEAVQSVGIKAPLIYKRICDAMADIESISKDRTNQKQGYNFRGIDDVYNALHDVLSKHRIFTIPEVLNERTEQKQTQGGGVLLYRILTIRYTFFTDDGSSVSATVIGEGMDSGDKASNKAMSVGQKYAFLQVFCIATEDPKDPENDSHQLVAGNQKQNQKQQEPKAPEVYNASPEQRKKIGFAEMCAKLGVNTMEGMKALSASCKGTPLNTLFAKMKNLVESEQAPPPDDFEGGF